MSYTILSTTVITIILALFLLVTFSKAKGKIFGITLLGALIWGLSLNLIYSEQDLSFIINNSNLVVLYLIRLAFLGAMITVTGLVLFERVYLRKKLWNPLLYCILIIGLGYIFILTPSIVKNVTNIGYNNYKFEYGFLYSFYGLLYLSLFLYSYIRILYRFFTTKRKIEKSQLRFFVIGISLSFWIGLFTNLIYPAIFGYSDLSKFGPLGMVFVGLFTTYAIFKHHLFNIKMILSEILLGIMSIVLFIYIFLSRSVTETIVSIIFFIIFIGLGVNLLRELLNGIKREKELDISNRKLAETIESKDLFLRMTSHQLRTPLTSLNGFLSLVLEQWQGKYKMNVYTKDDIVKVYINTQRLVELVNDVLAINSIKAGRFGIMIRTNIDIKDEITYLIQDTKYIIDHFNTKVIIKTIGENFVADIDNVRMKSVFQNLLSNAIYYGKDKIWITLIDEGDRIKIRFRDNGKGIETNIKDKIFDSGFRVGGANDRNPNGSGFGLYISKTIVNMHNGTLRLKNSGTMKGALFELKLLKHPIIDKYDS
jgi:signal transduction histidine kinase